MSGIIPKKKMGRPKRRTPLDKLSRERVRQIQETALGRLRRRLYAMGITCMDDLIQGDGMEEEMKLWIGMVYNNRGDGIAPMYLEKFMRFCEVNGLTDESGYKLFKEANNVR